MKVYIELELSDPLGPDPKGHVVEEHHCITVWKSGTSSRAVRCEIEHLGEDCFEVRIMRGKQLVNAEFVEGTEHLLDRANELKDDYGRPRRRAT